MQEGKVIFHMEAGEEKNRFHIRAEERTFDLHENYEVVGQRTTLQLEAYFPNVIYGVKVFPGLDPEEARLAGEKMIEWAAAHGERNDDPR